MPDDSVFAKGALLYPQPVAVTCGRICRARTLAERLDAVVKCAETTTRYVAALAISSFAAREDAVAPPPPVFAQFRGNLAFGDFLSVIQGVAKVSCEHPIKTALAGGFKSKGAPFGVADAKLSELLTLRNREGHGLNHISPQRARRIFDGKAPDVALGDALGTLEPVLGYPLFTVEERKFVHTQLVARRLLLMGESQDPTPESIELGAPLEEDETLYLGLSNGVLPLHPWLIWTLAADRDSMTVFLPHVLDDKKVEYVSVYDDSYKAGSHAQRVAKEQLAGVLRAKEDAKLADGRSFAQEWIPRKQRRAADIRQPIDLRQMDADTVQWYADRLGGRGTARAAREVITQELFDGRTELDPDEHRQLRLLLGKERDIKLLVRRSVLDCRVRTNDDTRWDQRLEVTANVIQTLRAALDFIGQYVGIGITGLEELQRKSGTADYIALREALVNMMIHQDYVETSMAAQIEITPRTLSFYNPGYALVGKQALARGGKSQSRNPLLSRALRQIGFTELAGSGLREVYRAYSDARRPLPVIESDEVHNTFTLTLDMKPVSEPVDEFWQQRLGAALTPLQATALVVLVDGPLPVDELADRLGVTADEAEAVCQVLTKEVLIETIGDRVALAERLRPLAEEARERGL